MPHHTNVDLGMLTMARCGLCCFAEALGSGSIVFLGCLVATVTGGLPPLMAGFGFGLSTLMMVFAFYRRSGAQFLWSTTMMRTGLHVAGLAKRPYLAKHETAAAKKWGLWLYGMDLLMGAAVLALQLGSAFLGVLLADALDKSGLLSGVFVTKPNGNLADRNSLALLGGWALKTCFCVVYGMCVARCKDKKIAKTPRFKVTTTAIAYGAAIFVALIVSYNVGLGSALSLSWDLALSVIVPGSRKALWISIVSDILAAITAFCLVALFMLHDTYKWGAKHPVQQHHHHQLAGHSPHVHTMTLDNGQELSTGGGDF